MKIEHLAIWVQDLELMRAFYEKYFKGKAGKKYHNPQKNFSSYFISFNDGCRLEIMNKPELRKNHNFVEPLQTGIIHFAMAVGNKQKVDDLTNRLRNEGFTIIGEPRLTGDGYYESVVLDPEDNRIEITI